MKDFDHPHVLGLSGVCLDNPTKEPLILLPYMANGDLKSYITNKRGGSNDASTFPEVRPKLDQVGRDVRLAICMYALIVFRD